MTILPPTSGALVGGLVAGMLVALASAPLRADGDEYQLTVDKHVTVEVGRAASVSLTIAAQARHRISRDGPVAIRVRAAPTSGIALRKTRYGRRDAADARADNPRFDVRFESKKVGEYELLMDVRFWVCARRTCRPVRERVRAKVSVVTPSPAAGADAGTDAAR